MLKKVAGSNEKDDYYIKQIDAAFARIKVLDDSQDKVILQQKIMQYFKQKFETEMDADYEYEFIDLFCGAGGLSVGLEQEGFRPTLAIDKDKSALSTYKFNRPWLNAENIVNEDIRELVNEDVFHHVPLVVGGPPCQGFSIVNKQKKENDERNELYKFYVHAVEQSTPNIFLMENVEGILKLYDIIKDDFSRVGYITCQPIVLNTKDFGFPQNRRRAFILGISDQYAGIADELYGIFCEAINAHACGVKYTLWDAISDLPKLKAKTVKNATYLENADWGFTFGGIKKSESESEYVKLVNRFLPQQIPLLNHRTKYNNERDICIYQLLKPGEKSDAESIQEINPYKNRADIFRDKFDKLVADEPCKTITAHMYYDCNMYIHPYQARGLTPREAARVQGFPDDYLFLGSPNEWYRQIGNAVSPLMSRILAIGLKNVLKRINGK